MATEGSAPVLELEALMVKVMADASGYFTTMKEVQKVFTDVNKVLNDVSATAQAANNGLSDNVAKAYQKMAGQVKDSVQKASAEASKMGKAAPTVDFSKVVVGGSQFYGDMDRANAAILATFENLDVLKQKAAESGDALRATATGMANLFKSAEQFSSGDARVKVAAFMNTITGLSNSSSKLNTTAQALSSIAMAMKNLGDTLPKIEGAGAVLSQLVAPLGKQAAAGTNTPITNATDTAAILAPIADFIAKQNTMMKGAGAQIANMGKYLKLSMQQLMEDLKKGIIVPMTQAVPVQQTFHDSTEEVSKCVQEQATTFAAAAAPVKQYADALKEAKTAADQVKNTVAATATPTVNLQKELAKAGAKLGTTGVPTPDEMKILLAKPSMPKEIRDFIASMEHGEDQYSVYQEMYKKYGWYRKAGMKGEERPKFASYQGTKVPKEYLTDEGEVRPEYKRALEQYLDNPKIYKAGKRKSSRTPLEDLIGKETITELPLNPLAGMMTAMPQSLIPKVGVGKVVGSQYWVEKFSKELNYDKQDWAAEMRLWMERQYASNSNKGPVKLLTHLKDPMEGMPMMQRLLEKDFLKTMPQGLLTHLPEVVTKAKTFQDELKKLQGAPGSTAGAGQASTPIPTLQAAQTQAAASAKTLTQATQALNTTLAATVPAAKAAAAPIQQVAKAAQQAANTLQGAGGGAGGGTGGAGPGGGAGLTGGGFFGRFFKGIQSSFNGMFNFLSGGRVRTISGILYGLMYSFRSIVALFGVKLFGDFDDALVRTMARMGDFQQKTRGTLTEGLVKVASNSTVPINDLTRSIGVFAATGQNAAMALKSLAVAEQYAVVGGIEMARATRELVDIQNSLGLASRDTTQHLANMTRISDVFVRTSMLADASVEQLAEGLNSRYAAALRHVGYSLEQGVALLGAFADAQIKGQDAGNRATLFLQTLEHALINNVHMWRRFGIAITDARGNLRGPSDILKQLENRFRGMTSAQSQAAMELLGFNELAARAVLPLMGMSGAVQELETELLDAGGVTAKAADMIRQSFGNQLQVLMNNIRLFGITVGEHLAPVIGFVSDAIRGMLTWFMQLNPAIQRALVLVGTLTVSILPLAMLIKGLINTFVGPIFGVIGLVLGGLFKALSLTFTVGKAVASVIFDIGKSLLTMVYDNFKIIMVGIYKTIVGTASLIRQVVATIASTVVAIAKGIYNGVVTVVNAIMSVTNWIIAAFSLAAAVLAAPFVIVATVLAGIFAVLGGILSIVKSLITNILTILSYVIAIAAWIAIIATFWGAIAAAGAVVWGVIQAVAMNFFAWAQERLADLGNGLAGMWNRGVEGLVNLADKAAIGFRMLAGFLWNFRQNIGIVLDWFGRNWREVLTDAANIAWTFTKNMAVNFKEVFFFVKDFAIMAFAYIFSTIGNYAGVFFKWFAQNWQLVMENAGIIGATLAENFGKNFWTTIKFIGESLKFLFTDVLPPLFEKIGGLLEDVFVKAFAGIGRAAKAHWMQLINLAAGGAGGIAAANAGKPAEVAAALQRIQAMPDGRMPGDLPNRADLLRGRDGLPKPEEGFNKIFGDFRRGLVGPLEGLPQLDFNMGNLARDMRNANANNVFNPTERFNEMLQNMRSPLEGFVSTIREDLLSQLNLTLPENATEQMIAEMKRLVSPAAAEPGQGSPFNLGGGDKAGNTFKQISFARTMLGGPADQAMDEQHWLQIIASKMDQLIGVTTGNKPLPAVGK